MKPLFERRHYEWLAALIREWGADEEVATSFADALEGTNQNFNRARFLKACGVDPN